jgi:hypothetical protein
MARSPDWEKMAMAQGDPKPAWPMPTVPPKFATWSIGGGRPSPAPRTSASGGTPASTSSARPTASLIIAPEDALVVGIDRGWSEGAKAAFLRTNTGLFLVLGGFKQGSHKEYGIQTGPDRHKGDKLGHVLGSYGMIHLETYEAEGRKANSVWWKGEPPPDGLLNPTNYVERMVGDKVSLVQTRQRHEALKTLGYYTGDVGAAWGPASTDALRAAQQALGVEVDGKWGPEHGGRDPARARGKAGLHHGRVRRGRYGRRVGGQRAWQLGRGERGRAAGLGRHRQHRRHRRRGRRRARTSEVTMADSNQTLTNLLASLLGGTIFVIWLCLPRLVKRVNLLEAADTAFVFQTR